MTLLLHVNFATNKGRYDNCNYIINARTLQCKTDTNWKLWCRISFSRIFLDVFPCNTKNTNQDNQQIHYNDNSVENVAIAPKMLSSIFLEHLRADYVNDWLGITCIMFHNPHIVVAWWCNATPLLTTLADFDINAFAQCNYSPCYSLSYLSGCKAPILRLWWMWTTEWRFNHSILFRNYFHIYHLEPEATNAMALPNHQQNTIT